MARLRLGGLTVSARLVGVTGLPGGSSIPGKPLCSTISCRSNKVTLGNQAMVHRRAGHWTACGGARWSPATSTAAAWSNTGCTGFDDVEVPQIGTGQRTRLLQ